MLGVICSSVLVGRKLFVQFRAKLNCCLARLSTELARRSNGFLLSALIGILSNTMQSTSWPGISVYEPRRSSRSNYVDLENALVRKQVAVCQSIMWGAHQTYVTKTVTRNLGEQTVDKMHDTLAYRVSAISQIPLLFIVSLNAPVMLLYAASNKHV